MISKVNYGGDDTDKWQAAMCPTCKTVNPANVKYCVQCGNWLVDNATAVKTEPVKKKKSSKLKYFLFGVATVFILLIAIGSCSDTSNKVSVPTGSVQELKAIPVTDVSYDDLARNTEQYVNKNVRYRGKVIQVVESPPVMRINVAKPTPEGFITESNIILVTRKDNAGRILEDDTIEVWGVVAGPKTYEAVLKQSITIPEIVSYHLEVVKKAGQ